jgi:hypothetical protein
MIKNMTPHTIRIALQDESVLEIASSGVARVATTATPVTPVEGVPAVTTAYGAVVGLPAYEEGVTLLVSGLVLAALKESGELADRPDVWGPDTGPSAIRKDGQVWAVRGLTRPA